MSRRGRLVVAGLALAMCGAVAGFVLPASATVGPTTSANEVAGQYSCTTNASGYCTINHTLGSTPEAVDVTLASPTGGQPNLPFQLAVDTRTATNFRVRALTTTGAAYANSALTINAVLLG